MWLVDDGEMDVDRQRLILSDQDVQFPRGAMPLNPYQAIAKSKDKVHEEC